MGPERARRLLGLEEGATKEEVERAFRRFAWVHHPDRGGDARHFAEFVTARAVLVHRLAASGGQVIVVRTRGWRRALRVVQRWRWRARQPRPTARVR